MIITNFLFLFFVLTQQQSLYCPSTVSQCPAWEQCYSTYVTNIDNGEAICPTFADYLTCLNQGCQSDLNCLNALNEACQLETQDIQELGCTIPCSTTPPPPTIPSTCTNPAGVDCSFYINCLETYVPCGSSGYAVSYGLVYCSQYSVNYDSFSEDGQEWIDAVRKCLQVALVPYLSSKPSCPALMTDAFNSHVPCYTNPAPGVSICFIPKDWPDIINTIILAFVTDFFATLKQSLGTMQQCGQYYVYFTELKVNAFVNTVVDDLESSVSSFLSSLQISSQFFVYDINSMKRTSSSEYRLLLFGNETYPASTIASLVINATVSGKLNIPYNVSMTDCKGACDGLTSPSAAQYSSIFSVFTIVILLVLQLLHNVSLLF